MKHYITSLCITLALMLGLSSTAVGQYAGTGTFEKISGTLELTDGYYVIADQDGTFAMLNTNAGKFFSHEPITPTGGKIENPSATIVWKVQFNGSKFTIFNEASANFVSYSGSSNEAHAIAAATSDNQRWTASGVNSIFTVKNAAVTTRSLQYNFSSPRFACYTSSQKNLSFYKLAAGVSTPSLTPISPVDFEVQNINTTTTKNINVKGANLTGDLTVTVAGTGFSGSTTVTKTDAEAGKDVAISFMPTAAGAASGTATISGGGLANNVVVNLSGEGVLPIPALDPIAALDFGSVAVGASSSKNITVKGANLTGDLTVTVDGTGFTGSTTVTAAEAMATGGKVLEIGFNPTTAGSLSGTITISGGGLANSVVVNLTGVGSNAVTVFSENFNGFTKGEPNDKADGGDVSGSLDTYTTLSGWTGSKVYSAGGSVKMGTSSALGWIQTPQIDLSANGGAFTVSFKAMAWSGDPTSLFIYVNGVKTEVTGMSADANYTFTDYELTLTGGTSTTVIKFEGKQASKGRFFIDELVISQERVNTPVITAADLSFGTVNINTSSVQTLAVVGANLTDAITVSVAGEGFATTTPSIAKEGGDVSISFMSATKGAYNGTVTLTSGSTSVTYDLTASAIDPADFVVADIAALKAKGTEDKTSVFTLTGDVTFVYRNGRNIFVKDETGGLLIYDEVTPVITTEYTEGDIISGGIKGKITVYGGGLFEFIPTENTASSTQNDGTVTAESVSITTLKNNYATYESRLINLSGVSFATGSFTTSSATNLDITQDGETIICRNAFKTLDITPNPVANVRGFVTIFNGSIQIYPRDNSDIYTTVGCDPNEIARIKVISQMDGIVIDQVKEGEVIRVYGSNGVEVARQIATGSRVSFTLNKGFFVVKVGSASEKVIR